MATLVKFLLNKNENSVFAYFPQLNYLSDSKEFKHSYAHVGQHSACSVEYAKECEPANKWQFAELEQELANIGYTLKPVGVPKVVTWYSGTGYTDGLTLPVEVIEACYHSGQCQDDIERNMELPEVKRELAKLDPAKVRRELEEYGTWDDDLADHQKNLERILWIAAGDIQDNR